MTHDYPHNSTFDSVSLSRVASLAGFGFTQRQREFLVTVLVHAGCFLERQVPAPSPAPPVARTAANSSPAWSRADSPERSSQAQSAEAVSITFTTSPFMRPSDSQTIAIADATRWVGWSRG